MTVDIACATFNGAEFLPAFLDSVERQTYADWRLWVRDDGSSDETASIVRARAARNDRIRLLPLDQSKLGAAQSFGRALDALPPDAAHILFADQDDVWLPRKIELLHTVMCETEWAQGSETPVLVHSDLTVVDAGLSVLAPSFWMYSNVAPEPATLRRLVVRNPVTGAACMFNRALREMAGPLPTEAVMHDWWLALVASAFGRIVALPERTVLYRQHDRNTVGARESRVAWREIPKAIRAGVARTSDFRRGVGQTAAQARAFLERFRDQLRAEDRVFLDDYSRIPGRSFVRRKIDLLRMRALPEHGVLRTLGVLLRG